MNKETDAEVSIDNFLFESDFIKQLKEESIETVTYILSDLPELEVIIPDNKPLSQLDPEKIVDQDERNRPSHT